MPFTGADSNLGDIILPDETEMPPASEPEELKREKEELRKKAEEIHKRKPKEVTDQEIDEYLKQKNRLEKSPKKKVA